MAKLCRTCLAEIPDTAYVMLNAKDVKAETVQAQLAACVPELQLNLVEDPVVCGNCVSILELACTFKIRCLFTEKRIQRVIRTAKLNGRRVTLTKLFSFSMQLDAESSCPAINGSEWRDLGAVRNVTASGEQFFAKPEIPSLYVQSDHVEDSRISNYINSAAKEDSSVVINNDVRKVDTEEKSELADVTNDEIAVDSTAQNLECRENILESSLVAISSANTYEIFQDLDITKDYAIVKKENEIFPVKSENDVILYLKKENFTDEDKRSNACKPVMLSEVSNIIGGDVTEETPNLIHDARAKGSFVGDYKFPLFTIDDENFEEENYSNSSYSCDLYSDATSSSGPSVNKNIIQRTVASTNHEEERTNDCSTSSLHLGNNAYTVSRDEISRKINDTGNDNIIKEECELETFKAEDEELLHEVPIKESSFNVDELLNSIPQESLEDATKKSDSVREMNKTAQRNLIKNNRAHTDEESFPCTICDFNTTTKLSLVEHDRTHQGKRGYYCNECEFSTAYKCSLVVHMSRHTGNKPFHCSTCDYKTARRGHFVKHMRTHTGEKPFRCDICEYSFAQKANLVQHMRTHTGEKPFRCDICEFSTARKSSLANHVRLHTGEKPFRCNVCDYNTTIKFTLVKHLRTHYGEKPYYCTICGYSTIRRFHLTEHMRTHTGEKPFRCDVCEYSTAHRSSLTEHMRTHTDQKRFPCSSCEYKAHQKGHLVNHMRKHSAKKIIQC